MFHRCLGVHLTHRRGALRNRVVSYHTPFHGTGILTYIMGQGSVWDSFIGVLGGLPAMQYVSLHWLMSKSPMRASRRALLRFMVCTGLRCCPPNQENSSAVFTGGSEGVYNVAVSQSPTR